MFIFLTSIWPVASMAIYVTTTQYTELWRTATCIGKSCTRHIRVPRGTGSFDYRNLIVFLLWELGMNSRMLIGPGLRCYHLVIHLMLGASYVKGQTKTKSTHITRWKEVIYSLNSMERGNLFPKLYGKRPSTPMTQWTQVIQ